MAYRHRLINVLLFLFILASMVPRPARADTPEDGGTESLFWFGTGARDIALGGAVVAKPADFSALYWNPACLDFVPRMEVGLFHTSFLEDTPYDFASFTFPTLRMGTFGGGLFRIGTEGIQEYDSDGVPGRIFSFSQEEFLLGYGKRVIEGGSAGLVLKIDHQQMFGNSATGVGLDAAFSYIRDLGIDYLPAVRTGIVLRNLVSPSLKLVSEVDTYPASLDVGVAVELSPHPSHSLTPLLDIEKMGNHDLRVRMGIEYHYLPYLSFRGGFNESATSLGFGIRLKQGIGFDYALRDADVETGFTQHLFSVNYAFGLTREEKLSLEKKDEEERIAREVKESFEARKKSEIEKHVQKAQQTFEDKDYFASLGEWQQVMAWDENNSLARETIEEISSILSALQEERDLDAATRAASQELFEVGIRYYTEKRYPEAISSWERVLEIDPGNTLSHEYMSKAWEEAKALIANHVSRANQLIRAGDNTGALNEYHLALRYDPQALSVLQGIKVTQNLIRSNESFREGLTLYLNDDFQAASRSFTRALELNPENTMVKDYLAEAQSRMAGKTAELRPELEKDYLEGVDRYLQGRYAEAIEIWEKILVAEPRNQRVLRNIAAARDRLKTIEELGSRKP